jgi:molybdopterin molybdotransferase
MSDVRNERSNAMVRMRGFISRATVEDAWQWTDKHSPTLDSQTVTLENLAGRVLAEDVQSEVDVPGFERAMMDGFAVIAADTIGAGPYNHLPLAIIGDSLPGRGWSSTLRRGQTIRIMTGAPVPEGADAVLPVEKAEIQGERVFAQDQVTPGKHIARRGEDVAAGTRVFRHGRRLRPQDVGVISSIGIREVQVIRRPLVRLVITGNELLPSGSRPTGCQIADANGPMLEALVQRDGGVVVNPGIVPDEPEQILAAMTEDVDVVLISGGSSVGQEDHAPAVLAAHGELAVHGIAMRPSSPAGMGKLGHRIVFLLPGNPVSCLCAYDFFAGRAIRAMGGLDSRWPYRQVNLPLTRKLVSTVGRVDYARVKFADHGVEPLAISGASILTSTTRADGFVVVPEDSEGYPAGTQVLVWLYD